MLVFHVFLCGAKLRKKIVFPLGFLSQKTESFTHKNFDKPFPKKPYGKQQKAPILLL
jgi:hypothetical protein